MFWRTLTFNTINFSIFYNLEYLPEVVNNFMKKITALKKKKNLSQESSEEEIKSVLSRMEEEIEKLEKN